MLGETHKAYVNDKMAFQFVKGFTKSNILRFFMESNLRGKMEGIKKEILFIMNKKRLRLRM